MKTPPFILDIDNIKEHFFDSDFKKGVDYYKKGKVIETDIDIIDDNRYIVYSTVHGSSTNIYQQEITISREDKDSEEILIDGVCSCPVEYDCKHVVASLLSICEKVGEAPPISDAPWLDKLLSFTKQEEKRENKKPEYRLEYRLLYSESGITEDLKLFRAKLLKSGGYSKGAKLELYDIVRYTYSPKYDYLSGEDRTILAMIGALMGESWSYSIDLRGELGASIVKMMIDTNKAYYANSKKPLQYSNSPISAKFHWEKGDNNKYILKSNISRKNMIPTSPPMVIDVNSDTIHQVAGDISADMLLHLIQAPAIEEEHLSLFIRSSFDRLPHLPIPMPSELIEGKTIEVSPTPKLLIYPDSSEHNSYRVELRFLYQDSEILPYPEKEREYLKNGNDTLLIKRDLEKEAKAIKKVTDAGFRLSTDSNSIFNSILPKDFQESIEKWRLFLQNDLEKLKSEGWIIEEAQWDFIEDVSLDVESVKSQTDDWFELSFTVEIEGNQIPLLPLVTTLLKEYDSIEELPKKLNLYLGEGKFIHISSSKISPILSTLFELYDEKSGKVRVKPYNAHLIGSLAENSNIRWIGSREIAILAKQMRDFRGIEKLEPSPHLKAELRDYQTIGLSWLGFLHKFKFGGVLADDMGLGKTLQTLAFLDRLKYDKKIDKPSLIIMPTSLLGNWRSEIEKFTPNLKYIMLYGTNRDDIYPKLKDCDIILTSYQIAQRDSAILKELNLSYLILDEAQRIKNPRAKITTVVKHLKADYKLALTGTPMENHLGELWSIFDFLMPSFLGNQALFKKMYQNPIEKENNINLKDRLRKKISPFMLRRSKDEVLDELPEKIEILRKVPFGKKQALLYENVRVSMENRVKEEISKKGIAKSRIMILDALLKLRQICCDPSLISLSQAKHIQESAKREMLMELLDELIAEGRKILIFSQFTSMLSLIEDDLKAKNYKYSKLTGQTKDREGAINRFKEEDCNIFLISLKAGGVGLNLVEADTVIHYDPWWNPAVENQATDRAYRIGQTKTLFVYKLIVENSIEEKILKLQESKSSLQKGIYSNSKDGKEKIIDANELIALLSE